MQLTIRPLTAADVPFLRRMLLAGLFRRPRRRSYRPALPLVVLLRAVSRYWRGWGRDGDAGLVAEHEGRPVGAVWYRLFTEEEHGDGYVDPETPELAIAVVDGFRGRGIGRQLLETMHDHARAEGLARMALSVDAGNPARRLYAALGYEEYEPEDGKGRMVLEL